MLKALLIDDLRSPREEFKAFDFTIVRTSREALDLLLKRPEFDSVFFDHDLGGDDTTRPVASFLREQNYIGSPIPIHQFYIHTANPVGANWLKAELQGVAVRSQTPIVIRAGDYFIQ